LIEWSLTIQDRLSAKDYHRVSSSLPLLSSFSRYSSSAPGWETGMANEKGFFLVFLVLCFFCAFVFFQVSPEAAARGVPGGSRDYE
jgi:uncharacterized membrane protein YiaA